MSTNWLLALHITGAFLFFGGSVAAGVLNALAWRAERPSEIAVLLGLIRRSVPVIGIGSVLTLGIGLWLVHRDGFSFGAFWIWAAIALWVIANALGGRGGRAQEKAREEAVRCAAAGDVATDRLRELVRDPTANALSGAAGVATLLILVLMIWEAGLVILAFSRPFWPLFLHVLGAMTLFGAVIAATLLSLAAWRRPLPVLARSTSWALLLVALPAWVVTEIGARWIASDEGRSNSNATWLKVGSGVLEPGLVVLLAATAVAFWWARSGKIVAGRLVAGLASVYLIMLAVAWLAMSVK